MSELVPPGRTPLDAKGPSGTLRTPATSLLDDQNRRWLTGERVLAEDYVARNPALHDDSESLLDLIYNEIRLREESGETPELEEYRRRFPHLDELLCLQFEVHRAMNNGAILDAAWQDEEAVDFHVQPAPLPVIDGYDVKEELGRGAMGVVYKAYQRSLYRHVAIKMILAGQHAGPVERERFAKEAQAVARLQHPHIVQIHEVGEQDGWPYFCMEYIGGGSLAHKLAGQPLSCSLSARLVEMLARAVHHAHEAQIVHRDLKPANVLLAPSDPSRGLPLGKEGETAYFEPKITDFGLAKLLDGQADAGAGRSLDHTYSPVGTPPYMAPELASGAVGPGEYAATRAGKRATDVYALGAILYETLTGRPPFLAATALETLHQVKTLDPVPPRRLQPRVPRDLETICLACLRKEPQRRYATALDLADDLRRFLDGKPIRQRPAAFWEPAYKWARRRPAAAAWVMLAVIAFFGFAVGSMYYLQHHREWARQRALDGYRQFTERRDDALFQGTLSEAAGLTFSEQTATATAIRNALALAGVDVNGPGGPPVLDPYLRPAEKEDVTDSCYELLIALAGTLATPRAAQNPAQRQERLGEAMSVLDRAMRMRGPTRAYYLARKYLLQQQGDRDGAEAERQEAESLPPASASDFYLAAEQQSREGDTRQAIASIQQALRLRPNHFMAQCLLAISALKEKRAGEAQLGLTGCIAQRPLFAWTYLLRGQAFTQLKAFSDAESDFAAALNLDSSDLVRYAAHACRGEMWYQRGNLEQAAADLRQAIAVRPGEIQAHVTLAQTYRRQGKWSEAQDELDQAIRLRPDEPALYRTRADFSLDRKQPAAALPDLDRAIELERPGNLRVLAGDHVQRGRSLLEQGRYLDAVKACDAALRIWADDGRAYQLRGKALLKLERFKEAETAFGKSIELGESTGDAFRLRGFTRMQRGEHVGAIEDYTKAMHRKRDADILQHRGWAYFFNDALKIASRDFDEAIALDTSIGNAWVGRGLTRVMLGDYQRAVADANEVLRQKKADTPDMLHNLGCLFAQAAGRVQADTREAKRVALEADYRRQAVAALGNALVLVPREKRLAFWQEKMRPNSALDPIRKSPAFVQFDREVTRQYSSTAEKGNSQGPKSR
jgi:serine/threonine protein kinase/Flp pilus assembly protein TadD